MPEDKKNILIGFLRFPGGIANLFERRGWEVSIVSDELEAEGLIGSGTKFQAGLIHARFNEYQETDLETPPIRTACAIGSSGAKVFMISVVSRWDIPVRLKNQGIVGYFSTRSTPNDIADEIEGVLGMPRKPRR
jgi:hypothetical protein